MECTITDREIIVYILRSKFPIHSENFYVIQPRAYSLTRWNHGEYIKFLKQTIKREITGHNLNDLVDKLVDKNRKSPFLKLKTNPLPGFIVDYIGNFSKYFKNNGGEWIKLKKEHPRFRGFISLSLPAIDRKNNLALILVSNQSDGEAGYGVLILLNCNPLSIIKELLLWIS